MFNKNEFFIKNYNNKKKRNGDWGLGPIPNPQSPIPNPQSPCFILLNFYYIPIYLLFIIFIYL